MYLIQKSEGGQLIRYYLHGNYDRFSSRNRISIIIIMEYGMKRRERRTVKRVWLNSNSSCVTSITLLNSQASSITRFLLSVDPALRLRLLEIRTL